MQHGGCGCPARRNPGVAPISRGKGPPQDPANLDLFGSTPEEEDPTSSHAEPSSSHDEASSSGAEASAIEAGESPSSEPPVWTVSQINQAVRALLEETLPPVWISGEVANWKRAASGHCYFSLKDEKSQLRCVMWRGDAARLPMDPDEGMRIRAFGQITLYEARGEYQLSVRKVEDEEGEGLWKLAFERLRKKLEDEGLLLPERKRPLPRFPQTVGVVTSLTGAALHDILTVLRRRAPWLRVLVKGTRVQGEGAAGEIAHALAAMARHPDVEVVIVGRGGGSLEDLWAFNEEPVARAIVDSAVPVVSAVGHEVDVTISDLVADLRAPTPSAAAEAVVPDADEILRYLEVARQRLSRGLRRTVEGPHRTLGELRGRLRRAGAGLISPREDALNRWRESLAGAMDRLIQARSHTLVRLGDKMNALSPLATLQRGYAVPLDDVGRVLRRIGDFRSGEPFTLRVLDGRIRAQTLGAQREEVDREG